MAEYRLHCFAQSGNSYKPALLLALAGADWEPVWVDFFNGGSRTAEFLGLNEMGEAPVLEHGEVSLAQSGVILDYLAQRFRDFAPRSEADRREALRWILWDNHKLTSYTASLRFMLNFLPEEKRDPAVAAWLEGRAKVAFGTLDRHLAGRDWIVGDRPSIADLSCAGYVFYDGEIPFDLSQWENVQRWRQAIAALPGWAHPYELMPGHPRPGA